MDPSVETFAQLVVVLLGGLLILRVVLSLPGWLARKRRPERRSILVVGVGGGGGNAVDRMVEAGTEGVGFIACNTDAQALRASLAGTRIRIGDAITRGLGAGGDPSIGQRAAEEDRDKIAAAVAGADLVFVTAGLGGGTGSGAAPVVAAQAREQGALTIGVVTKPFAFEGTQRMEIAEEAATKLLAEVDALITVPNEHVSDVIRDEAPALEAFRVVDEVLLQAAEGIINLLHTPGLINLDFADVRAVVQNAGPALIGIGRGFGPERAIVAARHAVASPLLEARMRGAHGILFHVAGPPDLRLGEVRQAADEIRAAADPRANVIFGASLNGGVDDEVVITLIATGLDATAPESAEERADQRALARHAYGAWQAPEAPAAPADVPIPPAPTQPTPEPAFTTSAVELPPATPAQTTAALHPRSAATTRTSDRRRSPRRPAPPLDDNLDLPTFLRNRPPAGVR